jgi:hypothetical protein
MQIPSEQSSVFSFMRKKGVTANEFKEDIKKHKPMFVKSLKKIDKKMKFYYGPYE